MTSNGTERSVTAAEVRQAVRGVMAAFPKGTRFSGCKTKIVAGSIEVDVTVATDSVQALDTEGRHEAIERIRERARDARRS